MEEMWPRMCNVNGVRMWLECPGWWGLTLMNNVGRSVFSLSLSLCLAGTEEAFSHFLFLNHPRHPKNLISILHAPPAHCIQSRALTIPSACVSEINVCAWCGGRQAGRIPLCLREAPRSRLEAHALGDVRRVWGGDDIPGLSVGLAPSWIIHAGERWQKTLMFFWLTRCGIGYWSKVMLHFPS